MKKYYILLIFAILIGSPVTGDEKITSFRIDQEITIDGKATDWETIPMTFFEDDKMSVGIAHTDEFLYLLLKTRDGRIARMIKGSGLKIWMDKNGKKKKECGLIFTGGPEAQYRRVKQSDRSGRDGGGEEFDSRRQGFANRSNPDGNRLIFIDEENYVYEAEISNDGFEGPQVAGDTSLSFYTYEIAMPLGTTSLPIYRLDLGDSDKLLIGLEWGGRPSIDRDENSSGEYSGRMGGGGGGGGGRMGGGGRGGGGHGGYERGRMTPQKSEIWIKVSLEREKK